MYYKLRGVVRHARIWGTTGAGTGKTEFVRIGRNKDGAVRQESGLADNRCEYVSSRRTQQHFLGRGQQWSLLATYGGA